MNKNNVEKLIPIAINVIENSKLYSNGKVSKACSSQISTFGAAISQGSLLSAVLFFGKTDDKSKIDRRELLKVIHKVISEGSSKYCKSCEDFTSLEDFIIKDKFIAKKKIIDACIAIKLALNVFILDKE